MRFSEEVIVAVQKGILSLRQKDGLPLILNHPEKLRLLADRWATDGETVVVQAQQGAGVCYEYFYQIKDAHLPSFEVLNERYAKDEYQAYYITGKTIRTPCPQKFRPLGYEIKQHSINGEQLESVWIEEKKIAIDDQFVYFAGQKHKCADGGTYVVLGGGRESFYARDKNQVFWLKTALVADVNTFIVELIYDAGGIPLFATDHISPFHGERREEIIDQKVIDRWTPFFKARPHLQGYWWHELTTMPVEGTIGKHKNYGLGFEFDGSLKFYGRPLSGFDVASFEVFEPHFCGDKNGIYLVPFHGRNDYALPEKFSDRPVSSLKVFDIYLCDDQSVYCHEVFYLRPNKIKKADLPSFESLGGRWAKDRNAIYYDGVAKKNLDANSFCREGFYAWDKAYIFNEGKPLVLTVERQSLEVLHPRFLLVNKKQLFCGKRSVSLKKIDVTKLVFLNHHFARDSKNIFVVDYFGLVHLPEADYDSFEVKEGNQAVDVYRTYCAQDYSRLNNIKD